jgi:DNA-binding FadR family transcriptional regulator
MPLAAKLHADIARSIAAGNETAAGKAMDKLLDMVTKFTHDTVTTDF